MSGGTKNYKLKMSEKVSYSFGDCAGQIYVALCTYFLTGYYTDTVGVAALAVGTMMMVARLFDGVTDLFMGTMVDKTKSKHGKARAWILWTTPLMAIALIAMFNVPSAFTDGGKLVYAYISYILLNCIIYTANGIAYNSLLSRMTLDIQDRVSATSIRFVLGNLTTLLVSSGTALLVSKLGWRNLIIIYALIMFAFLMICFWGTKEHIGENQEETEIEPESSKGVVPLGVAFASLAKNKYFFMQALMMVFLYINIMCVGSMTYYFCNSVLGSLTVMTLMTMAYTIPTIFGSLINPLIVAKMGKRKVLIMCFLVSAVGRSLVGIGGANLPLVIAGVALHGLALGPIYSNVFAMTPDIVDYGEWKTGVRSEGLVTCCVSFGMKVGIGVGGAVATWVLSLGGYVGTAAVQTETANVAIRFGFGYLSVIFSLICLVIILVMNLDKDMDQIQKDLMAKHKMV